MSEVKCELWFNKKLRSEPPEQQQISGDGGGIRSWGDRIV